MITLNRNNVQDETSETFHGDALASEPWNICMLINSVWLGSDGGMRHTSVAFRSCGPSRALLGSGASYERRKLSHWCVLNIQSCQSGMNVDGGTMQPIRALASCPLGWFMLFDFGCQIFTGEQ